MSHDIVTPLLSNAIKAGTILLLPTIGEIFSERAGILNLGVEGMMLIGAFFGFIVAKLTNNPYYGIIAGMAAGGIASLIHAFVCITLKGNQIVSGLALTIFGAGFTTFYGQSWINMNLSNPLKGLALPVLSKIPLIGPVLFNQDLIVYLSYLLTIILWIILYKTTIGLNLRAVGENAKAANSMGISVSKTRYFWTFFGGLMAGAGGAYLTVAYAPFWLDGITAGRGWIAVALVIFAMWDPIKAIFGAYLFGSINALQFQLQASGTSIPSAILNMMPYLVTFIVIVISSIIVKTKHIRPPKELGIPYFREEK
ncbi:ABC transporter permease [Hippea maritima]|uniref:ABC-type transporter, integral membrane subunit n=1 Tax=Hippea maritima (strain ATCC 700847 / DSM 10411 / MH2) TaxID=760142 RepID=F2LX18_HIPMA|nr:ABC transporter permease [Hippea maritima]AEA34202.1 ABC-type transporter, integral membrane subunit [Hippea maritima DSM 10411]